MPLRPCKIALRRSAPLDARTCARFKTTAPGPTWVQTSPEESYGVQTHIEGASGSSIFFSSSCIASAVIPSSPSSSTAGSTNSGKTFQGCDASKSRNRTNATSRDVGGSKAPGCRKRYAIKSSMTSPLKCGDNMCAAIQRFATCVAGPYAGNRKFTVAMTPACAAPHIRCLSAASFFAPPAVEFMCIRMANPSCSTSIASSATTVCMAKLDRSCSAILSAIAALVLLIAILLSGHLPLPSSWTKTSSAFGHTDMCSSLRPMPIPAPNAS
mmetsp:Transcript_9416/g.39979  ORF Transcript_9416/g.39979 Transcript_9416/m.39979 type:complete len:269 (+) Transcript_9416:619-1425(+)